MNNDNPLANRLEELLVSKVTEGWNTADEREFEQTDWSSLETNPTQDLEELECAAAAFAVVFEQLEAENQHQEQLPGELHDKILANAKSALAGTQKIDTSAIKDQMVGPKTNPDVVASVSGMSRREVVAWLSTAAGWLLALLFWGSRKPAGSEPVAILTAEEKLAQFMQLGPADLVEVDWQPNADQGAKGKVVWSDAKQEGYMVFEGMQTAGPRNKIYQLWIFDTDKGQKHPVDGGVFDVSSSGKSVVPIDARIPVDKAVMFAITEEDRPVVVSEREVIPVLAVVEQ